MPQIFHRSTNILSRVSIFGFVIFAGGLLGLLGALDRSSYNTGTFVALEQPDLAPPHAHAEPGDEMSMFPPHEYPGYAWGMTIDLNACTGWSPNRQAVQVIDLAV